MTTNHLSDVAAAQRRANFSRRRFLKGAGACVALPALESLLPPGSGNVLAAVAEGPGGRLATTATGAPMRFGVVYVPNGTIPAVWWPEGEGKDFTLNKTMEPLADVKSKMQVFHGLDCMEATPGPDGGGDHARAGGSFLTGVRAKKTSTDIRVGVSIDQILANRIGHLTPFQSLELTCDDVRTTGSCDSGYACAYQYNLAWRSPTVPVAPEPNPRLLFERMFGEGATGERKENMKRRMARQKSILDYVMSEAASVESMLSSRDKMKLDEYLTSVRSIEQRIEKTERMRENSEDPNIPTPTGIPEDYVEYIRIMFDMMTLAFQSDQSRIITFLTAYEGSNRTLQFLGFPEGHHTCTHHNNRAELVEKTKVIDLWYATEFARFLKNMDKIQDVDGKTLLDNSMILYGSGNADGNRHTHNNLPIILAGGGGGTLDPGKYVKFGSKPLTNLFLSMTDRFGVDGVEKFGDSTGRVDGI